MPNKSGFIHKLALCTYFLFSPLRKHVLSITCGHCGGSNIIRKDLIFNNNDPVNKIYTENLICMNCKASCREIQYWHRKTGKEIRAIKDQIQNCSSK